MDRLPEVPKTVGKTSLTPAMRLSWADVMAWRVRRHHLDRRAPREAMLDVVAALCGLQAQLMSSAELALWARVEGLEPEAVQRALWEERSLVKTWAMRGTLHLLPADELLLWQTVLSLDRRYLRPSWLRYFGVSPAELERLIAAVAQALDGRLLTREELAAEVSRLLGSAELGGKLRHSWGTMLKPAAFRGHLCFCPSVGQNVRFTRPDRWLGGVQQAETDTAEQVVTRRFLATYGPTTREVFAQWLGTTAARAGALIKALDGEVTPVDLEGIPAWTLTSQLGEIAGAKPPESVRLLPAFDQYVIAASRHASSMLPGPFKDRIYRPQGWISPVLLVDGRMDGVWRHKRTGGRLEVHIEPFVELSPRVRNEVEGEAERLAGFFGARLELVWADQAVHASATSLQNRSGHDELSPPAGRH
ncbi:MAG: AlkZ family DNA glycosylase [Chloroflexi bacterium]|nr:AlkZ family DNA glycosylase [Chloroflexota bacterium]